MMTPLAYFLLGFILCAVIVLIAVGFVVNCSRQSDSGPDPERRTGKGCRRTRYKTAHKVDDIADAYGAEALTYPQATARLRDLELPAGIDRRVLKPRTVH